MRLPNFLLCCVILVLGSIAIQNFTNATSDTPKFVSSDVDIGFSLSDSDLDKINGIVNEKLDPIREDLRIVEKSLSDRIDDLQNKIVDCSTRTEAVKAAMTQPVAKSGGSTGNSVANKYESKPSVVKSGGGSTGTVVQNVYSQPAGHWSYPGDIATHMQIDHGQSVAGMSIEQQLSVHDAIHESQPRNVTRTVTSSNVQTSNCPGGVCPTSSSTVSRSVSSPRLFGRLFGR